MSSKRKAGLKAAKGRGTRKAKKAESKLMFNHTLPNLATFVAGVKDGKARTKIQDKETGAELVGASVSTAVASSFLDSGSSVYRFRVISLAQITTDGSGNVNSVITCDPTAYTDYSSIAALFGEIRLVKSMLHLVSTPPLANSTSSVTTGSLPVAFQYNNTSTAPGVGAGPAVYSVANAELHSWANRLPSVFHAKIPPMEWATTSSPAPGPYAGCYGAWVMARGGLSATTIVLDVWMENVYEVRDRQ